MSNKVKTITKTFFGKYEVEIEINLPEEPSTQGWVAYRGYTASLERLLQTGKLENGLCDELDVPDKILHKIEDWAYSVGY